MRAVIIATGNCPKMSLLNERYPNVLLPLVDRPFIQHVVELLVDKGILKFDFILSHLPEKVEELLGDGTRWGSKFIYHLVRDSEYPYKSFNNINLENEPVILGHADRFPLTTLAQIDLSSDLDLPILFDWRPTDSEQGHQNQWTGWAVLSGKTIADLPKDLDEGGLRAYLLSLAHHQGKIEDVSKPFSAQSYSELLQSNNAFQKQKTSALRLGGKESDERIRISRNVSLHPTAKLIPPVYVGENSQIGKGVQLGPNVVIQNNCVLDERCTVEDSLIFSGSYVGETIELNNVIVDKNSLINVRLGAEVMVTESFMLGNLSENPVIPWLSKAFSRLCAILLLALFWPVILATVLVLKLVRKGPVVYKKEVVSLPASSNEARWKTFYLWRFVPDSFSEKEDGEKTSSRVKDFLIRFLPALINIAKGELSFVGVEPRTKEEIKSLPSDWKALYLSANAGIITEAYVYYGANPSDDERYSAETLYAVSAGMSHDLKLISSYFFG